MFFRYDTEPARLLKLFNLFRHQALRLRRHRRNLGLGFLLALPVYGAATLLLPVIWVPELFDRLAGAFRFFLATGIVWLVLAWGGSFLFRRYPRGRSSPGNRAAASIGLIFIGVPAVIGLLGYWGEARDDLVRMLVAPDSRGPLLATWIWAGVGLFLAGRGIVWLRLKDVYVEEFELEFLYRLLYPLLRDLPEGTRCSLVCNPFAPVWTMEAGESRRGAYIFRTYDDTLLEFKATLADGTAVTLRTQHRRIDKFKNKPKKLKDKGSKHRIVQAYRIEHPALKNLAAGEGGRLRNLESHWHKEVRGYASSLRWDPEAGRLVVVQKKKFAASRNLESGDLPSAELVLKTVRALSGFAAGSVARLPGQRPA